MCAVLCYMRRANSSPRLQKERKKKGLEKIEWGKWGILTASGESFSLPSACCTSLPFPLADIYTKDTEFRSWLVGERMINPETLTKAKEKEIFLVRGRCLTAHRAHR